MQNIVVIPKLIEIFIYIKLVVARPISVVQDTTRDTLEEVSLAP